MKFFDHKKIKLSTTNSHVVSFPGNHFPTLKQSAEKLQKQVELADANKFKNSISSLVNRNNKPQPTVGLFKAPQSLPINKPKNAFKREIVKPGF